MSDSDREGDIAMAKRKAPDGVFYIWLFGIGIEAMGGFGAGAIYTILLFRNGILAV